jgi:sugar phosphate isomerase/epimerase
LLFSTGFNENKPTIGFTVDNFKSLSPSTIINALKIFGVQFVEINMSVFDDIDKSLESLGNTKTSFHLPYHSDHQWDLAFPGEQTDWLLEQLATFKEKLNIQHLVCHPPEHLLTNANIDTQNIALFENLIKIELPVYFENIMSQSPDEYYQFVEIAKQHLGDQLKGMCWDACHFLVAGYNPIKRFNLKATEIGCIHLSDCYPDEDAHLPFTRDGSLPLDDIIDLLVERKFAGYITLEIAPRSLRDLSAYINSYLILLRHFDKKKYFTTRMRFFLLKPLLDKMLSSNSENLKILN